MTKLTEFGKALIGLKSIAGIAAIASNPIIKNIIIAAMEAERKEKEQKVREKFINE